MQEDTRDGPDLTGKGPVLVAVDFSADSREAVLWASHEAARWKRPLTILHVVHDPAASPGFYREIKETLPRPMADVARDMMDDFIKAMRADHPELGALGDAEVKLVIGLPAGRIVEVAAQIDTPLIVIGSRGLTGLPHILIGSVAERVVQLAPVPVVVVK